MVRIRLQRLGRKNRPYYRVAVMNSTQKREGKALALIGRYDPANKEFELNKEEYDAWIAKGAQPSERVKKLAEGQIKAYKNNK